MKITNIRTSKLCAFCKYWYDPTNSAIRPKNPVGGFWEFDDSKRNKCLVKNLPMTARSFCSKYECKV